MARVVIDSSALIALLQREPGSALVLKHLPESVLSVANLVECVHKLAVTTAEQVAYFETIKQSVGEIVPVSEDIGRAAAALSVIGRAHGLSLGDRLCLASGIALGLPVLSADRAWAKLKLPVKVLLIR